jgi:thiol-disulfide isomerase/thioredoxin
MQKIISILFFSACIQFANGQSIPKWKITDVEKYMAQKDAVLVINFWDTFCKPCVAEIPSFISITNQYKKDNVKLLLVSLDLPSYYPAKIATFSKKHNFKTSITWLNETNADYFCPKIDPAWSGSIPSTVILNTKTGYRKFFEEEMTAEDFEKELKAAIKN